MLDNGVLHKLAPYCMCCGLIVFMHRQQGERNQNTNTSQERVDVCEHTSSTGPNVSNCTVWVRLGASVEGKTETAVFMFLVRIPPQGIFIEDRGQ